MKRDKNYYTIYDSDSGNDSKDIGRTRIRQSSSRRSQSKVLHYYVVQSVPKEHNLKLRDLIFESLKKYFFKACVAVHYGHFNASDSINHHILVYSCPPIKLDKIKENSDSEGDDDSYGGYLLDSKIREPLRKKYRATAVKNKIFEIYSPIMGEYVQVLGMCNLHNYKIILKYIYLILFKEEEGNRKSFSQILVDITDNYDDILLQNIQQEQTGIKYQMRIFAQYCFDTGQKISVLSKYNYLFFNHL